MSSTVFIGVLVLVLGFGIGAIVVEHMNHGESAALRRAKRAWRRKRDNIAAVYMAQGYSERDAKQMAEIGMEHEANRRATQQVNA